MIFDGPTACIWAGELAVPALSSITSRLPLAAVLFTALSMDCGAAAMAAGMTWLLIPYGALVAAAVTCAVLGCKQGPAAAVATIFLTVVFFLGAMLFCRAFAVWGTVQQMDANEQLGELSRGMLAYYRKHERFPPAAICDPSGKPLLSWRVALLPFLEKRELYERFKLDEAWDSPHNRALIAKMPTTYAAPHRSDAPSGTTVYQVLVGSGTAFDPATPLQLPPTDFPGGPRELLLIVEAAQAVPWTKPQDLPYAADQPLPPLGGVRRLVGSAVLFVQTPVRGMWAVDAAGDRHWIELDRVDEETLRHFIAERGEDQ
jgi:hypothetical protein